MRTTIAVSAVLALVLLTNPGCNREADCPVCPSVDQRIVPFETIEDGAYFHIPSPAGTLVIREEIDWLNLWSLYWTGQDDGEKSAPPHIDFETEMVIGVKWGVQTGCHNESESIRFILEENDTIFVIVDEMADLGLCDMIVYPIHLVKTARSDLEVVFMGEVPGE